MFTFKNIIAGQCTQADVEADTSANIPCRSDTPP